MAFTQKFFTQWFFTQGFFTNQNTLDFIILVLTYIVLDITHDNIVAILWLQLSIQYVTNLPAQSFSKQQILNQTYQTIGGLFNICIPGLTPD